MLEDETFDEFYSKLSVIRNSTINLEKKMDDAKVVKKILRSLPERFIPQVAAIQQSKDLNTMSRRTYRFSSDFWTKSTQTPENQKYRF